MVADLKHVAGEGRPGTHHVVFFFFFGVRGKEKGVVAVGHSQDNRGIVDFLLFGGIDGADDGEV